MKRRWIAVLPVLGLALAASGCNGTRELEAELGNVRTRTRDQLDVLKKQNELLNRRLNDMNSRVDKLSDSNDRLSTDLTTYSTRPDEIKIEILTEVNTRFSFIATRQQEFEAQVDTLLLHRTASIADSLQTGLAAMEKTLAQHSTFVHYVAAEQDSINRVFANRFDSRPWYQSYMGKWEDMQRARAQTP
jgi:chromosome segregation ATPase